VRSVVPEVRTRLAAVRGRPTRTLRWVACRIAGVERLPTSARAVAAHYANGGRADVSALALRPRVETAIEEMVDAAFDPVETGIAEEYDLDPGRVTFDYGTKLLMPAELTLAQLYRPILQRASDGFDPVDAEVSPGLLGRISRVGGGTERIDPEFSRLVRRGQRVDRTTELVVFALLDGDMRDAINDGEYDGFEATVPGQHPDRRQVAEIAQETLEREVQRRFERFPDGVRRAYDRAVATSEAHQDEDDRFRNLLEAARNGDPDGPERIRDEYRDAAFDDPPVNYGDVDLDLPYFRTQYGRVGVIYDGMVDMYAAVGIDLDDAFRRAIVLAIIAAQVWLDDVDDFEADMADGQLTPVTAEYLLAASNREAYRRVVELTDRYASRAREHAADSDSTLVRIAVEYVLLSGDPSVLPGAPDE
jgi:hypothetical protein